MPVVGLFDGPHATERGFNLAVLHPANGVVVQLGKFDVASNCKAGAKMARFVADVPDGYWVLVAVKGNVHSNSTSKDVKAAVTTALRSIGGGDHAMVPITHPSQTAPYFVPKLSFAMVGRKGLATPAKEQMHSLDGPAIACGVICGANVAVHSSCARGVSEGMAWFALPRHFRQGAAMYEHEQRASWLRRGLSVLVLDPVTAVPTAAATFDTHGDRAAAEGFVDFIAEVPAGCPVLVAAHDEASKTLSPAVYTALQSIGGTGADLEFRHSFALVGRKGMVPGDACETPAAGFEFVTPLTAAELPDNSPDSVPRWYGSNLVGPKHVGAHPVAATATVALGVQARAVSSRWSLDTAGRRMHSDSTTCFQIVREHEDVVLCAAAAAAATAPSASAVHAPSESSPAPLLSELPLEGIAIIAEYLEMEDVLTLRMTSQVFRAIIPPPITIQPVQLWGFRGAPAMIRVKGKNDKNEPIRVGGDIDGGWAGFNAYEGQSNEPFAKVALTPELLGRGILCIGFKATWRDQGWGNQKGCIILETCGEKRGNMSLFPFAPHALATVKSTPGWSDEMMTDGEPGDALKFYAHIGGGGGHTLRIDAFSIAVINRF